MYNSLKREVQEFVPIGDSVGMYLCGPTVYDRVHLGNCRSSIVFDVWYRFLRLFYKVKYVRNITDIDDKIINKALETGLSFNEIALNNTKLYQQDMQTLNVLPPDYEPKATDFIAGMIAMIQELMARDLAYCKEGHVFFAVDKLASYGILSNRKLEELLGGARVEVNEDKRHVGDFVLWKPSLNDEPGWPSSWGAGRPGWHIECSVMASFYLGDTFDIHGGGRDLIFPHHENERAQSCGLKGEESFAKYWLHNGMLTVAGKKMSKSLGNFIRIDEALLKYRPEVIRYVLLMAHYRQDCDFSKSSVVQAQVALTKLYKLWSNLAKELDTIAIDELNCEAAVPGFIQALCDDLNVPKALSCLYKAIKEYNGGIQLGLAILFCGKILGLVDLASEDNFSYKGWFKSSVSISEVEDLIKERNLARANKDFVTADKLRVELQNLNVIIKDDKQGTCWEVDGVDYYTKFC